MDINWKRFGIFSEFIFSTPLMNDSKTQFYWVSGFLQVFYNDIEMPI